MHQEFIDFLEFIIRSMNTSFRSSTLKRFRSNKLRLSPMDAYGSASMDTETNGYITFSDVARPLPSTFFKEFRCCNSKNCECYCEL